MALTLTSSAFNHEQPIPKKYTCEGDDLSPSLAWTGLPEGSQSLVLIVDDPDAPDPKAPKRTWVHWLLYNLPVNADGLDEGIIPSALPNGTLEGVNDGKRTGYGGPCPPTGRHRYYFKLYALGTPLPDLGAPTKSRLLSAMEGHVLEQAELMGTYEKQT